MQLDEIIYNQMKSYDIKRNYVICETIQLVVTPSTLSHILRSRNRRIDYDDGDNYARFVFELFQNTERTYRGTTALSRDKTSIMFSCALENDVRTRHHTLLSIRKR